MPEETTATPEQIQAEIASLRSAPFGAGESQLDRSSKIEGLYRKLHPEDAPAGQGADWGDAPSEQVSEADGKLRSSIEGYLSEAGLPTESATALMHFARSGFNTPLTDRQLQEKGTATEATLRAEWGASYDQNLALAYGVADAFEAKFKHPDLEKAMDQGLWLNPDVLRTLLDIARAQKGNIRGIRDDLMQANQNSLRSRRLQMMMENHYKAKYGV